jgi:integrase
VGSRPCQIPARAAPKRVNCTVGEFLDAAYTSADLHQHTIDDYARALRTIVCDVFDLDTGVQKFDHYHNGYLNWLESIHAIKLARLTPDKVQRWKRAFLARAGTDPLAQRRARISVNSLLRRARSLFSPVVVQRLPLNLPSPLPFDGIAFETHVSARYHSDIDIGSLIHAAGQELAPTDPEVFKAFLLAVMVGLRRKEIDLLEWSAFQWDRGAVRIQPTKYFHPKSEDSIGDIPVDPEVMKVFLQYRTEANDTFVISSTRQPKPGLRYIYYRCQKTFERLIAWLRSKGVRNPKAIHTLRKEFGSRFSTLHGIHAASTALRHSSIGVTSAIYVDSRTRVSADLGRFLPPPLKPADAKYTATGGEKALPESFGIWL